jgi:N-acetylglucosamine-6-phosphate deacetylase
MPDSAAPSGSPVDPQGAEPVRAVLAVRGTAVLEQGVLPGALLLLGGGRILWAGPEEKAPAHRAERTLEHPGLILPGLVDLHCHGGGGASFPDCADAEEAMVAVREHRRHGTTSLVASLVTASAEELAERVRMLAGLAEDGEVEAIHLEGPFISEARKGAQNPAHITGGDAALVGELCAQGRGAVATMTMAPETASAAGVIDALAAGGAVPSLGHTDCDSAQMDAAITASRDALRRHHGRSALPTATHLFNGMRPIHHRDPGPALAALDAAGRGEIVVEVIADGVHLAAETVAHVFSLAADGCVVLITDAMAAAGMADGSYRLGALDVDVRDGVATLAEGGSIAGGTAHLIDVVRFAVRQADVDLATAVRAATEVPARVLGREDEIGALRADLAADVLLVDAELRPVQVIRRGELLDAAPTA